MVTTRGRLWARPRISRAGRPADGAGGRRWPGRLAAFALGMPLALAFPKPALWWLAFVALAPLLKEPRSQETWFVPFGPPQFP